MRWIVSTVSKRQQTMQIQGIPCPHRILECCQKIIPTNFQIGSDPPGVLRQSQEDGVKLLVGLPSYSHKVNKLLSYSHNIKLSFFLTHISQISFSLIFRSWSCFFFFLACIIQNCFYPPPLSIFHFRIFQFFTS